MVSPAEDVPPPPQWALELKEVVLKNSCLVKTDLLTHKEESKGLDSDTFVEALVISIPKMLITFL